MNPKVLFSRNFSTPDDKSFVVLNLRNNQKAGFVELEEGLIPSAFFQTAQVKINPWSLAFKKQLLLAYCSELLTD